MGKKQHFIPKFLLKNWSTDRHSVIEFLLKTQAYIHNCPIRSQSKKDFYYGKDQKTESWLAKIETQASPIIKKLLNGDTEISFDDRTIIVFLLTIQLLRTPSFNNIANNFYEAFEESFDPIILQHFKNSNNNEETTPERSFVFFREVALSFFDLRLILLKAKKTNYFAIGQDPLFIINPLLADTKASPGNHGLGLKGVVFCMPISPLFSLCFYDRHAYYPSLHNNISELDDCDINLINKYQILRTNDCLYSFDESDLLKKLALSINRDTISSISANTFGPNNDQFTHFSIREYEFPQQPMFLRIKEKAYSDILIKGTELTRPEFNQVKKKCFEKWGIQNSVTVVGTPLSEDELKTLNESICKINDVKTI